VYGSFYLSDLIYDGIVRPIFDFRFI